MWNRTRIASSQVAPSHAQDAIIGRRAEQQDSIRTATLRMEGQEALLIVVADGMGGAVGGRLASTLAADAFVMTFEGAKGAIKDRLERALNTSNDAIAAAVARDPALKGMGTTMIGAVLCGNTLHWVSVGDSLLIVHSGQSIRRVNADHSLASMLDEAANRGEISYEEALRSPQRNVLRSALTGDAITMTEFNRIEVTAGATIIAATDGMLTVSTERLAPLIAPGDPAASIRAILEAIQANMPADQDNVSIVAAAVSVDRARARSAERARFPLWGKLALIISAIALVIVCIALVLSLLPEQGRPAREDDNSALVQPIPTPTTNNPATGKDADSADPPIVDDGSVTPIDPSRLPYTRRPDSVRLIVQPDTPKDPAGPPTSPKDARPPSPLAKPTQSSKPGVVAPPASNGALPSSVTTEKTGAAPSAGGTGSGDAPAKTTATSPTIAPEPAPVSSTNRP